MRWWDLGFSFYWSWLKFPRGEIGPSSFISFGSFVRSFVERDPVFISELSILFRSLRENVLVGLDPFVPSLRPKHLVCDPSFLSGQLLPFNSSPIQRWHLLEWLFTHWFIRESFEAGWKVRARATGTHIHTNPTHRLPIIYEEAERGAKSLQ